MELVDAWILHNPLVKHSYPNTVYVELVSFRCKTNPNQKPDQHYCLTQFSSYSQYEKISPHEKNPICMVKDADAAAMRKLWERFVREGWQRVDAATPHGCGLAVTALKAREYRYRIMGERVGVYTGAFFDPVFFSDAASCLYFPSISANAINTEFHPVTNMPQFRLYTDNAHNHTANTQYALEA